MSNIPSNHSEVLADLLKRVEALEAALAKLTKPVRRTVQQSSVNTDSGGGPGEEHP